MLVMRFLTFMLLCSVCNVAYAQMDEVVDWTVKMNDEGTAIEFTATMDTDWVIYSQHTDPEGPIPLEFEFTEVTGTELIGTVKELTTPITVMSEMFEVEVIKFKKEAAFIQKLKADAKMETIKGTITYMTCDSKRCLPPTTIEFQLPQ